MNRHYVSSGVPFSLGRTGEHLARAIVFDLSQWKNLYGEGEAELMARRSGETIMYPVPLDIVDDAAIWIVTENDVAIPGSDGECELRYRKTDGTLAKSETWTTSVRASMQYEESEPPVEAKPWIETLDNYITEVIGWRDSIEQTAKRAEEISERTEDIAEDVRKTEEARDAACEHSEQAQQSATAAEKSQVNAAVSENNAAQSEENAFNSAGQAAQSASEAVGSAEAAASSENAAAKSANTASSAGTAAINAANNAANSASNAAKSAFGAENSATNAANSAWQAAESVERIENMSVEAVVRPHGTDATVTKESGEKSVKLLFGIPQGKSAYHYALDFGYSGTEQEFAVKLAEDTRVIGFVADGGKPNSLDRLVFDGGTPFTTDDIILGGGTP